MADLLTLTEYKNYAGISLSDTSSDTQLTKMLAAVSAAIRNFTDRSFDTATSTGERIFQYDGSGILEIDDATAVTAVSLEFTLGPNLALDSTYQFRPMPYGGPVYTYLVIPNVLPWGISPEMGYMQNLDQLAADGRLIAQYPLAHVTGTWGWPTIPEDVKLAALWTLEDWGAGGAGPTTPGVVSEAIEGFSRSFGSPSGGTAPDRYLLAVPNRARDILAQYQRIFA
jgi:hypothetical protein